MKYLIYIFLLFFVSSAKAQTVSVSDEIILRNDFSYDILGLYDERTLLFRNKIYKQEIQVFDPEMNMIREKEITLEDRKSNVIGVLGSEEFFSIVYNYRKKGDVFVMMKQFDGDLTPIDSNVVIKVFESQLLTPSFEFERSENRRYGLVYTTDRDNELDVMVIDIDNQRLLWENKFVFTGTNLRRDFRNITVSDEGEMFLMLEKNNLASRMDEHVIEYYKYGKGYQSALSSFVPLPNMISFDINFKYDNVNKSISTVGLYSDKNFSRTNGVYLMRHKFSSDRATEPTIINFPEDMLLDIYGKNVGGDRGIADLEIQDILLRQDGGIMLIAEIKKEYSRRPYYTERTYYGSNYNYQTDFHYEDLVVFSIHPDGTNHWNTVLHKRQYSHDDNAIYSSFFVFKTPSKIRLVYNDEISRENTVSEYVIRGNGELIRNSLMSTEYQNLQLRFRDAVQVSSTEFIVPSQRQLKLNLVKVDYQ